MKNIKDITISIFAVIGFVAIITGFTSTDINTNQSNTDKWEVRSGGLATGYLLNKETGEVWYLQKDNKRKVN